MEQPTTAAATIGTAPHVRPGEPLGTRSAPRAGDTLWWHPPGGSGWVSRRIDSVSGGTGVCAFGGAGTQALLRLGLASPDTVPRGAPLRITRLSRYSVYRGGDGTWQLGISEWSDVLHAFAPPQPVAGPFTMLAAGGCHTGFRYFDAAGAELRDTGQGIEVGRMAIVRVTIVAPAGPAGFPAGVIRCDSLDVAIGHES